MYMYYMCIFLFIVSLDIDESPNILKAVNRNQVDVYIRDSRLRKKKGRALGNTGRKYNKSYYENINASNVR